MRRLNAKGWFKPLPTIKILGMGRQSVDAERIILASQPDGLVVIKGWPQENQEQNDRDEGTLSLIHI